MSTLTASLEHDQETPTGTFRCRPAWLEDKPASEDWLGYKLLVLRRDLRACIPRKACVLSALLRGLFLWRREAFVAGR